ncbi:MAG: sugar transferase [Phycisphaerae bacterium]|jgi:lipopolysaccharide/colanic/teichoic acid biosynthesis glycosyltransferase
MLDELPHVSPAWYSEEGVSAPPQLRRGERIWIVNGKHLPIVDWHAARSAVRRHDTEVLIFSSSNSAQRQYSESVLVSETGEVVKFKRHYCDSPGFTDLWNGEASLLVASRERAQAVLSHMLTRGWGLESVGALIRRFSVQWSSAPCVLSEFGVVSPFWPGSPGEERAVNAADRSNSDGSGFPGSLSLAMEVLRNDVQPGTRRAVDLPDHGGNGVGWHGQETPVVSDRHRTDADASGGAAFDPGLRSLLPDRYEEPWEDDDDEPDPLETYADSVAPGSDLAYFFAKRTIDIFVSASGLLLLSPLLVVVALLVKLTSPGPVFFGHPRQGKGGKEFRCLKFRSMRQDASALQDQLRSQNQVDGPQFKIDNDPRVTKIGPWLRHYNIDELPQLINVLLGQMSLVGPRPSPDNENQLCPAWRRTRLSVRPGITGLWQVLRLRNPNASDFQEWIYYDVEYVRHRSPWLDFQILLHTPVAMFAARRLTAFAERLERHGICTRAAALRRHYEGLTNR